MADDVLLNKAAAIERAVARVREEHAGDDRNLLAHPTRQDAILLNLQRACESSIDGAMHLVRRHRLGIPQETREAFDILHAGGLLDASLSERLKRMVGFRNVAIHEYQKLNLEIVQAIVRERLEDFLEFARFLVGEATRR
jgi:uncharacterized protein YutE (UPF0331/DUF86 family)